MAQGTDRGFRCPWIKMRWCLALGIVLVALVALTVKVSMRRPRTVTTIADEAASEQAGAPREPTPLSAQPRAHRPPGPAFAHAAAAHVFGRVLPVVDEEASFEDLKVTADDGARSFEARVFPDGRFSIHLPAGQYAVTATLGAQVGIAPSVAARPSAERELTIQLGLAASISGHVRGPDGVAVKVRLSLAGRDSSEQTVDSEDGDFAFEGLVPGRSYDLSFRGDDLRTTTLRSVTAPAEGVAAEIDALPILRGAIGFPRGEHCPIDRVALRALDAPTATATDDATNDADSYDSNVDSACQFQLPVPDGASQMLLVATGSGWNLEEPVSVPPLGDPDPVCLNPPCPAISLE
jgi:hypothetical protein